MKKICLLSLLVAFFAISSTTANAGFSDKLLLGVKGGVNLASMVFSDEPYSIYEQGYNIRPLGGVFLESSFTKNFSVRYELLWVGRGMTTEDFGQNYTFSPDYVDFRIPLLWNFHFSNFTPYLLVSPNFGFVVGGETEKWGITDDAMNTGYINNFDIGVGVGAGVRFPIRLSNFKFYLGVEGQYSLGLLNNFPNQADGNYYGSNNYGTRHNRGIEAALTLSFPIGSSDDRGIDTVTVYRYDTDTVIKVVYVEGQSCYTAKQIVDGIKKGRDVRNKDICLSDVLFDFAKSTIKLSGRRDLDDIVELLNNMPKMQMDIGGHTDNVGSKETNDNLSEARAKSVYDYLVSKGIDKSRLTHKGYGYSVPIASNNTEEGRAKNRRVTFEIKNY